MITLWETKKLKITMASIGDPFANGGGGRMSSDALSLLLDH